MTFCGNRYRKQTLNHSLPHIINSARFKIQLTSLISTDTEY